MGNVLRSSIIGGEDDPFDDSDDDFMQTPRRAQSARLPTARSGSSRTSATSHARGSDSALRKSNSNRERSASFASILPLQSLSLTSVQISTVRRAWAYSRRKSNNEPGLSILQHVLSNHEIRQMFGRMEMRKDESSLELSKDLRTEAAHNMQENTISYHPDDINEIFSRFRLAILAQQLTKLMDFVIKHLNNTDKFQDYLLELGRLHVDFIGHHAIEKRHWDWFTESMVSKSLSWGGNFHKYGNNSRTTEAWVKICLFVVECVRRGYQVECRRRRAVRATSLEYLMDYCRSDDKIGVNDNKTGVDDSVEDSRTNEVEVFRCRSRSDTLSGASSSRSPQLTQEKPPESKAEKNCGVKKNVPKDDDTNAETVPISSDQGHQGNNLDDVKASQEEGPSGDSKLTWRPLSIELGSREEPTCSRYLVATEMEAAAEVHSVPRDTEAKDNGIEKSGSSDQYSNAE